MDKINAIPCASTAPWILLAEDDPDQSDSLREVLELEGYRVETVSSGDIALQRLTSENFAAAVMDAHMPGLLGGTVLKVFHVCHPHIGTPVIMVSAFASPHDLNRYRQDGAAAGFTKPLNIPELLTCLRRLISANRIS